MATAYPCAPCQRALIQESRALASQPSPRQAALKGVKWRFLAAPIEKGQLTEGQTPWTDEARRRSFWAKTIARTAVPIDGFRKLRWCDSLRRRVAACVWRCARSRVPKPHATPVRGRGPAPELLKQVAASVPG